MTREHLTQSIEDYLKTIYLLAGEHGRVSTNRIAERMGVTPASVTGMLQKMASLQPPLVEYRKHHGVCLTQAGETVALEIIRHHRLLESYLHARLGYTWDEVHHEADRLEHVISEDFEARIAKELGNPLRDPHGEPIPGPDFYMPNQSDQRLSSMRPGQHARVQRVEGADDALLRFLGSKGLVPQAEVIILEYSIFDQNLRLQVDGQAEPLVLGEGITRLIFVEG